MTPLHFAPFLHLPFALSREEPLFSSMKVLLVEDEADRLLDDLSHLGARLQAGR